MTSRARLTVVLAGVLLVGLVTTSVTAALQARRAADAEERVVALEAEVARLRAEVKRATTSGTDEAPDGGSGEGTEGPFAGLFGGDDGLAGLFGMDRIPGAACMTGSGDIGSLFGGGDAAADPDEQVREIARQVADLRELSFEEEVDVTFLTREELSAELTVLLDDAIDPDQLEVAAEVLAALGAVPEDADLERMNRELLDEQVAGFYDPDDGRLVVLTPDDRRIRPAERIIIAHEVEHALADQAIGLPELDAADLDDDAQLAQLAVVEGDATLVMNLWALEHLSLTEQLGMAGDVDLAGQQESIERFPVYLQRELLFPYTAGLDLACERYLDGGWSAVDALYTSPPTTSAEVLFPERLGDGPGVAPRLSAPPGASERSVDTFGAAQLSWLFEAPGGDEDRGLDDPVVRASAWVAGEARSWHLDGELVVGLGLRERSEGGVPGLCDSVTAWYEAAFPDARQVTSEAGSVYEGARTAVIACQGDAVRVAIAPDVATATAVIGR